MGSSISHAGRNWGPNFQPQQARGSPSLIPISNQLWVLQFPALAGFGVLVTNFQPQLALRSLSQISSPSRFWGSQFPALGGFGIPNYHVQQSLGSPFPISTPNRVWCPQFPVLTAFGVPVPNSLTGPGVHNFQHRQDLGSPCPVPSPGRFCNPHPKLGLRSLNSQLQQALGSPVSNPNRLWSPHPQFVAPRGFSVPNTLCSPPLLQHPLAQIFPFLLQKTLNPPFHP